MSVFNPDDQAAVRKALAETVGAPAPSPGVLPTSSDLPEGAVDTETPEELDAHQKEAEKYGGLGGSLAAAALGYGRTATLGATDAALTKIFKVDPEDIKKLREYNENASELGDVASLVGPGILTSGAEAAVKAGKALTTAQIAGKALAPGLEAANAAGKLAKSLVKSGLETGAEKSLARQLLESTLAHTAEGGVQGTTFGAGQLVSDYSLGDPDLNAQKIISTLGFSALLGGTANAALGTVADIGPSILERSQNSIGKLRRMATDTTAEGTAAEGASLYDKVLGKFAKTSSFFSHEDPAMIEEALKNPDASLLTKSGKNVLNKEVNDLTSKLGEDMQHVDSGVKEAHYRLNDELAKETGGAFDAKAQVHAINHLDDLEAELASMSKSSKYTDKTRIEEAQEAVARAKKSIKANETGMSEVFKTVDSMKRDLGDIAGFGEDLDGAERGIQNTVGKLKSIYGKTADMLEDAEAFGPVGANQAAWNQESSTYIHDMRDFQKKFMEKTFDKQGRQTWRVNSQKVYRYVNNIDGARNASLDSIFNKGLAAMKSRLSEVDAMSQGPEAVANFIRQHPDLGRATEIRKTASDLEGKLKTEQTAFKIKELRHGIEGHALTVGDALSMGVLFHFLGPLGPVLHGAFHFLKHPMNAATALASVRKAITQVDNKINGSLKNLIEQGKKSAEIGHRTVAPLAVTLTKPAKKDEATIKEAPQSQQMQFKKDMEKYSQYAANPQLLTDNLGKKLAKISSAAPNISTAMSMRAVHGFQVLMDRAPKKVFDGTPTGLQKPFKPSDAEISRWYRFKKAVDDPHSVIEDMGKGQLSQEGVDALKSVYPSMFSEIQDKLMDKVTSLQTLLPYKDRLQLSVFFEIPMESLMKPEMVKKLQTTFMQPEELPKPRGSVSNLEMHAAGTLTPVQKIEAR